MFVPQAVVTVRSGGLGNTGDTEAWLDEVYSDTTLPWPLPVEHVTR